MISRLVPQALFIAIACFFLLIPLVQGNNLFRVCTYVAIGISVASVIKQVVLRNPVIDLGDDFLVIRGVRPGAWKLFQLWRTETIRLDEIVHVQAGYLRTSNPIGLKLPPVGEPSRNAVFQYFLWIHYLKAGKRQEIYYPHFKSVQNYKAALSLLRERVGDQRFEQADRP